MPEQASGSIPYPFPVAKEITPKRMAKLAKNPEFLADCEAYTRAFLRGLGRGGTSEATPALPFGRGSREDIMAFAEKWGVRPMFSPRLLRLVARVGTDRNRWGLIPVFPWTSRQEVLSRLEDIQKVIGKTHKDFLSTLFRDELIRWIKAHCRHNGKHWTWAEVGVAVLGKPRLSREQRQRLIRAYQEKHGISYKAALEFWDISRQATAAPAEAAKKAVHRLKTAYKWRRRTPGRQVWADPLTPLVTALVTEADTADPASLRAKLKDLGSLLLDLSLPKPRRGHKVGGLCPGPLLPPLL